MKAWRAEDLEHLGSCPICGGTRRRPEVRHAQDKIFCNTPGNWNYWACTSCHCVYLDPRPNQQSIGRAYIDYYTHRGTPPHTPEFSRGMWKKIADNYVRAHYHHRTPFGWIHRCLLQLNARLLRQIDSAYRYLPPSYGTTRKLLDVGCGSGDFLYLANLCGWRSTGIDNDAEAVLQAQDHNLHAMHTTLEALPPNPKYDMITMSHVIEHLHDPEQSIQKAHSILNPGGRIFIETPNANSFGLWRYKHAWRGLEPPRHLVIFHVLALKRLLEKHGFIIRHCVWKPEVSKNLFKESQAILLGRPLPQCKLDGLDRVMRLCSSIVRGKSEFITIVAEKRL